MNELTFDFPWLVPLLHRFVPSGVDVPHALVIHGPAGVGKRVLATAIARTLLCEAPEAERVPGACGRCPACRWFDDRNHPDYRLVTTEALAAEAGATVDGEADEEGGRASKRAPSREIKVDQVRALADFLAVATHRGRYRVVQVQPLDAMNAVASNALLKMLEEPPPATVFVAVTDRLDAILPTVVSRCQKIAVALPSFDIALGALERAGVANAADALAAAGGAPLAALAAAHDEAARTDRDALIAFLERPDPDQALALADAFAKSDATTLTTWIRQWTADCIAYRLAGRVRYHPARSGPLAALVRDLPADRLIAFDRRLVDTRRTIDHPLNQRLVLETLLLDYCEAVRGPRPRHR